ncbi:PspC domain-containing protein [Pediococcus siamensis]|uniref:PspC domain-containing protein n=1 Tax=Pediococcus siamensis TaxID=381829 RepID=UPI0039A0AFEE
MNKKLTKSSDKMISGVIGGFAEYLGIDKTLLRVIYAAIAIPGFIPCIILYFVAAWVMPEKNA